jgi:hypothetical protein
VKTRKGLKGRWFVAGSAASVVASVIAMITQGCSSTRPDAAAGFSATQGVVLSGPCPVDGATSTCHVETGRSGNVINCFSGTQTCHNGTWGACGETGATIRSFDLSQVMSATSENGGGGGLAPKAVTYEEPGPNAAACKQNPCNPDCVGYDVDAGALQPEGGFQQTVILGTTVGFGSFPIAKITAQAAPNCTTGVAPSDYQVCSYDYCCAGPVPSTTGTCQQWVADAAAGCAKPTGVDYTAGIGCQDSNGVTHIPVCNRGTSDTPSTGKVFLAGYPGNLNTAGTAGVCANLGTNPTEGCLIDLSVRQIKAGKCFDIDVPAAAAGTVPGVKCAGAADFSNGNRASMVNPPASTNLPMALRAGYGQTAYTQLAETDKCNNQSFVYTQFGSCATYGEQPPPPITLKYQYTSSCLPGFRPEWSQFAYNTAVPNSSQIIFKASTAPTLADGGTGTFTTPVTVADIKSTSGDPAICTIGGSPTGCPKNLSTLLGIPAKYNNTIEIGLTEIAITAIPTIYSWQVSYSCVPYE